MTKLYLHRSIPHEKKSISITNSGIFNFPFAVASHTGLCQTVQSKV